MQLINKFFMGLHQHLFFPSYFQLFAIGKWFLFLHIDKNVSKMIPGI